MERTIEKVNLEEWIAKGQGGQATTYENVSNPEVLVKLYNPEISLDYVVNEVELNEKIRSLGIHTPEISRVVTDGKRYGAVFKRIKDKKSFCRIVSEDPSMIENLAKRMADGIKFIHTIPVRNPEEFVDSRDHMRGRFEYLKLLPAKYKKRALNLINKLPTGKCYCHGDLHFGNFITDGKEDWVIDMGTFCIGSPELDFSNFFHICFLSDDFIFADFFHLTRSQAKKFWNCFMREYFGREVSYRESAKMVEIPLAILIYWSVGLFGQSLFKTILKTRQLRYLKYL